MTAVIMSLVWPLLAGLGVALAVSAAVAGTLRFHGRFTMDSVIGVQKMHVNPTPRVGGFGIYCGLYASWFFVKNPEAGKIIGIILIAGLPALFCGLLEDVTKRVGVLPRLLATMVSALLASLLSGVTLHVLNIPLVDYLLQYAPVAILLTVFAVAGVANAINIVDGFNGLAAGATIIALLSISIIAKGVGDVPLAYAALVTAAAVAGFLLVNFPMGKLFLGDGGAYFAGFALAWLTVLLAMRNPGLSSWSGLMVCAYPVIEVVFSIVRRRRRRVSAGDADRLHLHSLVNRRVISRLLPNANRTTRNSATGALMWLAAVLPAVIAILRPTDTAYLMLGFGTCAFAYSAVYARLTQFKWGIGAATMRRAVVRTAAP